MGLIRNLWSAWKKLAHKIGVFQSKVIPSVFYLLLLPFGFLFSFFKDALKMKMERKSTWEDKTSQSETIAELRQQY